MRGKKRLGWRQAIWPLALLLAAGCSSKPASIDISPKKAKIYGLERSQRLSARVLDKKGRPLENMTPNWSSSNSEIVAVEVGGRIVAKKEGKATVTASYEAVSAQVPVEVVDASIVEVNPALVNVIGPSGTSVPLQATVKNSKETPVPLTPTWDSSDPKIATVSPQGVVTSVAAGTAMITAKLGDLQGGSEVRVFLREIARLELRPTTALVRVGDSQSFEVVAYGADGVRIPGAAARFQTSDPAVATVDPSGKVSGVAAGTATIQAHLGGIKAEATLLVN